MSDKKVRVRFAPSPTGPLHMGGVRTALYNYLFAKKLGGDFVLRIEDTDQTRYVKGAEDYIIESLKWCGISPDEGQGFGGNYAPYRQSERKASYRKYADQLVEAGHAYYAFDTAEELDRIRDMAKQAGTANWQYNHVTRASMKNSLTLSKAEVDKRLENQEPYVIRIKLPRNEEVKFQDIIRGWVTVNTNNMDDKVLFKSDGMPTYHLANIVDDHSMEISHVIRGEEWLPSAPLHILMYRFFGWEAPQFAHLPLLLKPDGNGKLSKRDGDRLGFPVFPLQWNNPETEEVFSGYRENGYFPEAFVNMLAFLGWNPGTEQEIFSLENLVESFSLERVNKAGARYDHDKTKWFNQQYLRAKAPEELGQLLHDAAAEEYIKTDLKTCTKVAQLMKERAYFVKDMLEEGIFFFQAAEELEYDEKAVSKKWNEDAHSHVSNLIERFEAIEPFTHDALEQNFKSYLEEQGVGFGKVGPGFRLAVTGKAMGPSMFEICAILGKEETLKRMHLALEKLPAHG